MEDRKSAVPASLSGLFHHPLLARLQSADNLCFAPSLMSLLPPMILIGYCMWYWLEIFVYFCHQYEVFIAPTILIGYCIWYWYWLDMFGYFCHQCDVFIAPHDPDWISVSINLQAVKTPTDSRSNQSHFGLCDTIFLSTLCIVSLLLTSQ